MAIGRVRLSVLLHQLSKTITGNAAHKYTIDIFHIYVIRKVILTNSKLRAMFSIIAVGCHYVLRQFKC